VTKNNDALISQGFIFLYRIEERYRHDICKHTYKRSMYPHAQTSPQSFNPPKTTDLCLSLLVTPRSTRLICCCGADLGQLGLLRHIPHTARAKDVSAQLTGCNWSPEHDLDMGIHILMRQFFTMLGRILYLTAGVSISQHTTSLSRFGARKHHDAVRRKDPCPDPTFRTACRQVDIVSPPERSMTDFYDIWLPRSPGIMYAQLLRSIHGHQTAVNQAEDVSDARAGI
jgi:hypothetical protein